MGKPGWVAFHARVKLWHGGQDEKTESERSADMHNYKARDTFTQAEIQQVRDFLLPEPNPLTITRGEACNTCIRAEDETIFERLRDLCTATGVLDEPYNELAHAIYEYESVCLELGMKFGASLAKLLLTK